LGKRSKRSLISYRQNLEQRKDAKGEKKGGTVRTKILYGVP